MRKYILILFATILLASCAGTGKRDGFAVVIDPQS